MATLMISALPDGKHFTITELGQERGAHPAPMSEAFTEDGLREELRNRGIQTEVAETMIRHAKGK